MKKIFTFLCAAAFGLSALNAEVLLTEHFAQTGDSLTNAENLFGDEIASSRWSGISGGGAIFLNNTDLTYAGYKTNSDGSRSAELQSSKVRKVAAPLSKSVNSGSVYVAAIVDLQAYASTSATANTRDYLWALVNGTSSVSTAGNHFGRLQLQKVGDGKFQFSIAKNAESAAFIPYTDTLELAKYLVVTEYQFVDGEQNDIVRLFVNPTKGDKPEATVECYQTFINPNTSADVGAGTKADAAQLKSLLLNASSTMKLGALIDEIKVVSDWADLWESGDEPVVETPEMAVESAVNFYEEDLYNNMYIFTVFPGKEYSKELEVLAENLTEDITISHKNSELTLSTSTIDKAGGKFTVTLNPEAAGSHVDTIVYTSGELTDTTFVGWAVNLQSYSDLASLKAAYANDDEYGFYHFRGEAVITRAYSGFAYIQDETAALRLSNEWEQDTDFASLAVGDKIGGFIGYAGETDGAGVKDFIIGQDVTPLSQGNTVAAQVVTLAELQANGADYLLEIVTIENVELDQTAVQFPATDKVSFTQNGKSANIQPINSSADYVGESIPAKADVTGFSINKSGTVIVPRDKNDIVSKEIPQAIDNTKVGGKTRKLVRDGQLIIIRDGKEFNVLGTQL